MTGRCHQQKFGYRRLWMLTSLFALFFSMLPMVTGCNSKAQQDMMKWRVTLDAKDKRPYGAWLAFESLRYYFPNASILPLSQGYRYTYINDKVKNLKYGHALLVLEGLDFLVSDEEWDALKEFIRAGNEVVLFCNNLDNKIETELNCHERMGYYSRFYNVAPNPTDNLDAISLAQEPGKTYGYKGRSLKGYFYSSEGTSDSLKSTETDDSETDNGTLPAENEKVGSETSPNDDQTGETGVSGAFQAPEVLGNTGFYPDILRYRLGTGHLTLHAAPFVLSNYFLLQDGNEKYLSALWKTLPDNLERVYWNDYFDRHPGSSGFDVLWKFASSKMAILLAIFLLIMYILFEGKRKQRIIPIYQPLKNDSVSFVETVGRLYYNKGNHVNLEEKMVQQFLEWVRNHYFINTNLLDDYFIQQLSIKSGHTETEVRALTEMIREIKSGSAKKEDDYLYKLYNTIQQFYKKHP